MKGTRHTRGEIIAKLGQANADLANGLSVEQICRKLGASTQTYFRWRNQLGGMKADEMKRPRILWQLCQRRVPGTYRAHSAAGGVHGDAGFS
jgi:transposase-like protein